MRLPQVACLDGSYSNRSFARRPEWSVGHTPDGVRQAGFDATSFAEGRCNCVACENEVESPLQFRDGIT